jgi:hypothetical protein
VDPLGSKFFRFLIHHTKIDPGLPYTVLASASLIDLAYYHIFNRLQLLHSNMSLQELSSPAALTTFLSSHTSCVVTFSAHWCGPCNQSKSALQALASSAPIPMAIAYESDLGDAIHAYTIKAFPTYVLYVNANEQQRVEGVNLAAVETMMRAAPKGLPTTGGSTLGGGGAAMSPEETRRARLSKLGGTDVEMKDAVEQETVAPVVNDGTGDTTMAEAEHEDDNLMPDDDPCKHLDQAALTNLTGSMGFSELRAKKGLLHGGNTVEGAVEWLLQHQEDADIDDAIVAPKAQSYKCNECGKILSNMANLELHANKTGHSDFEESTIAVKPLTDEEKRAKIEEIKNLLKLKRAEREEAEKVDGIEQEIKRRNMGKEMAKTREQLDQEQRKRDVQLRQREKENFKKERARIQAELAKDKAERQSNKGKLSSRLGVDGYNPDGIQVSVDVCRERRYGCPF